MNWYQKLKLEKGEAEAKLEMKRRTTFINPENRGYAALKKKDPKRLAEISAAGHKARWGGEKADDISSQKEG